MLESFAYCRPGQTGTFATTLLGEEVVDGERVPVALSRIGEATITLRDEADGEYINDRGPDGERHVIVASENPGVLLPSSNVKIDPTTGALAWRWTADDTEVSEATDVAEYLAEIVVKHSDTDTPLEFDRTIIARHRLRIVNRPALCVAADVFRQLGAGNFSEEQVPLVEFLCEAVTDRFELETERLVRISEETEYLYADDEGPAALNLRRFPLLSITSVKEISSGSADPEDFADVDPISLSEFLPASSDVGQIGVLRKRRGRFTPMSTVEVKYVGGIARSAGDVPPALRNAAARQVLFALQRATDLGVTAIQQQGATVQVIAQDLLKDVEAVFRQYRRIL